MFQRLINQSIYQEMQLLQKFNDIGGKVLKPKKILPPMESHHQKGRSSLRNRNRQAEIGDEEQEGKSRATNKRNMSLIELTKPTPK